MELFFNGSEKEKEMKTADIKIRKKLDYALVDTKALDSGIFSKENVLRHRKR